MHIKHLAAIFSMAAVSLAAGPAAAKAAPPPPGFGCEGADCRGVKERCVAGGAAFREVFTPQADGSASNVGWCQPSKGPREPSKRPRRLVCHGPGSCALLKEFCLAAKGSKYAETVFPDGSVVGYCKLPPPKPRNIFCTGQGDCAALKTLCLSSGHVYDEEITVNAQGGTSMKGECHVDSNEEDE